MRFYLTTAIDYVNSRPHLGQAYEKVAADVIARYKRGCGVDTYFLMGNDEHSQNVYKKAREAGLDPLAYCDEMEQVFRERWAELTISFDDFIRTTEPRHRAAVQKLAQRSYDAGDIYEGTYEGWYCVSCEAFKPGEGPGGRQVPVPPDADARVDQGEELLLPAVEVPRPAAGALPRAIPSSSSPTSAATRSSGCWRPGSTTSR